MFTIQNGITVKPRNFTETRCTIYAVCHELLKVLKPSIVTEFDLSLLKAAAEKAAKAAEATEKAAEPAAKAAEKTEAAA